MQGVRALGGGAERGAERPGGGVRDRDRGRRRRAGDGPAAPPLRRHDPHPHLRRGAPSSTSFLCVSPTHTPHWTGRKRGWLRLGGLWRQLTQPLSLCAHPVSFGRCWVCTGSSWLSSWAPNKSATALQSPIHDADSSLLSRPPTSTPSNTAPTPAPPPSHFFPAKLWRFEIPPSFHLLKSILFFANSRMIPKPRADFELT